jgi:signal transduction histidine kinase
LRYRTPETPLRARDHELVDSLAGHLGAALHAHRLTIDLERARERLVLAREEERRRLRRDLHDGLGPALSGHLLRLDLLAGRVDDPTVAADIDELRRDLRATVAEVRRVVEGLRPPALDELGLVGALDQVTARLAAGSRTQISLRADELPPLSAAVEVAAFRIVTEAVTNVIKHADATTCTIELAVQRGRLQLSVSDNGTGLASAGGSGHGLQTMRERAQELRGRLRISTRPGSGTTIRAEVPVPTGRPKSRATATVAG